MIFNKQLKDSNRDAGRRQFAAGGGGGGRGVACIHKLGGPREARVASWGLLRKNTKTGLFKTMPNAGEASWLGKKHIGGRDRRSNQRQRASAVVTAATASVGGSQRGDHWQRRHGCSGGRDGQKEGHRGSWAWAWTWPTSSILTNSRLVWGPVGWTARWGSLQRRGLWRCVWIWCVVASWSGCSIRETCLGPGHLVVVWGKCVCWATYPGPIRREDFFK